MTSRLHFRAKLTKKAFWGLLIGPFLMSGLMFLPQTIFAQSAENGKKLYQTYCVACHTIGKGRLVGPDLKGVTSKRDPSWMIRWIREPDKMIAEGDPIATQLLKEYNNVPMSSFNLSEVQAKDIMAYMEAESAVSSSTQATTESPNPSGVATQTSAATTATNTASAVTLQHFPEGDVEKGKSIYEAYCVACHTMGGDGLLAGPDLEDVTSRREKSWLVRWLQEPDKMLFEQDPIAIELWQEFNIPMPNFGLSETQAKDILAYIEMENYLKSPVSQTFDDELDEPLTTSEPSGDAKIGKALFIGERSFDSKAPACISCHSNTDIGGLGGGTLGPDLTKVHSRYGGDIGLSAVLLSMPFPTMQPIFSKQTVLDSEVAHLNAYFVKTDKLAEEPLDTGFLWLGLLGVALFYILVHLIWRNRLTTVRKSMVGR